MVDKIDRDANDVGVPMLPGEPVQGPEDAVDPAPKRGDYRDRVAGNPHTVERVTDAEPGEPHSRSVPQRPHAENIAENIPENVVE